MSSVASEKDHVSSEQFPVDALPAPLAKLASELAGALSCPLSAVATPLLAVLAGAMGMGARLKLKAGHVETCVLWSIVIGDTLPMDQIIRTLIAPLVASEQESRQIEENEREQYEQDLEDFNAGRRRPFPNDREPEPPEPARVLLAADWTLASITRAVAKNPSGLLLARAELDAWLTSLVRSAVRGDAVWRNWRELYHAGTISHPRIQDGASIAGAVCQVAGSIAMRTWRSIDVASMPELLKWSLLAMPHPLPVAWTDASVAPETMEGYGEFMSNFIYENTLQRGEECFELDLDEAGKVAWQAAYGQVAPLGPNAASLLARIALLLLRAESFVAESSEDDEREEPDQVLVIERATRIVTWFERERARVLASLEQASNGQQSERVMRLIRRRGGCVTVRELMRYGPRFERAEDARAALDHLAANGQGRWEEPVNPRSERFALSVS